MKNKNVIVLIIVFVLSGCASQVTVTVYSDPPGAAVIQYGQLLGYTPMYLYYPKSVFKQNVYGCGQTLPLTIKWATGVERTETMTLCKNVGAYQQISFLRPDEPGRLEDVEFGIAMQRQALQRQQQALIEQQDALEALRILEAMSNTGQQSSSPTYQSRSTTDNGCTSDFSCGTGLKCVKAPLSTTGTCLKNVDSFGMQKYELPDLDSVGPNMDMDGQCRFDTDCPIGFSCDSILKACVK